jgi:hypothetical protein
MVSADDPRVEFANPFDDCIGIRPVPHNVAAAQNLIELTRGVFQHCVERFQIRVNVAENQETHGEDLLVPPSCFQLATAIPRLNMSRLSWVSD